MTSRYGSPVALSRWVVPAVGLALALVAVAGCSSRTKPEQQAQADITEYEAQIRKMIPDSTRADKLVDLTNEFQEVMRGGVVAAKDYRAKFAALNANCDATRSDYETAINEEEAARDAFLKKLMALRERAASLTTDAEWEKLKKARLRALDADLQDLIS